jgi:hypothetical protein
VSCSNLANPALELEGPHPAPDRNLDRWMKEASHLFPLPLENGSPIFPVHTLIPKWCPVHLVHPGACWGSSEGILLFPVTPIPPAQDPLQPTTQKPASTHHLILAQMTWLCYSVA